MILLEIRNIDDLIYLAIIIMIVPPILLTIIGIAIRKKHPTASNVLLILAGVYMLIGLGVCRGII